MEVSSHSIHQHRISGINFDGAVFTNITHDHLDYHKTFKEYIHVKKEFFDNLDKSAFAITNIDDKNGAVILQNTKAKKITYAINSPSDYKTKILEHHFSGMLLSINNTDVWTKFIGKFNAYNLTAIYAVACELGQNSDEVLRILSALKAVNGRFEHFVSQVNITAIVDYAHTPDALQNVLTTINEIRNGNESLITVVGAGGNRDKTKRPEMAKIAAELSNKLILTSDNPRFEDPEEIIKEMEIGVELQFRRNTISITDRKEAIKAACMFAQEGDIILIAGKGHETYQEIEGVKHHFDDKEIINEQLTINN
jgi:UDP-N-acetylmuramoyl-L-alanyl-D-glutamate--2,6-diaminopimelate ligase